MHRLLAILLVMLASLALGLGATLWVVSSNPQIGALRAGPWTSDLRAATAPDPYTRARQARDGSVGLVLTEGLKAAARVDDSGRRLFANCTYRVSGNVPPSRFWTLTAQDGNGQPIDTALHRANWTSSELMRGTGGHWEIVVSPSAQPGNWLPVSGNAPFQLMLMLYEPSILGGTASVNREQFPHIQRGDCR